MPPTPQTIDPATLVLVGAIAGAFGVKGEVRVRAFTAATEGVVSYGPLHDADGRIVLTPARWREIKDGLAVSGPEIKDRDAAEAARGTPLYVPRDVMAPVEEDEFYHVELIGCDVEALDGASLGEVHAVHNFGAGDMLEVKPAAGPHWFLDFTKATVPIVDLARRRLVATPIETAEDTP